MALSSDLHRRAMEPLAPAAALPSPIGEGADGELLVVPSADLLQVISSDDPLLDLEGGRPNQDGTALVLADDPAFDWSLPVERAGRSIDSGEPILGDATDVFSPPADRQASISSTETERSFSIREDNCGCSDWGQPIDQPAPFLFGFQAAVQAPAPTFHPPDLFVLPPPPQEPEVTYLPASSVALSGDRFIDPMLLSYKWGDGQIGTPVTITYSFPEIDSSWPNWPFYEPPYGFVPLTEDQRAAVRYAVDLWDDVADIQIREVPDVGDNYGIIRFSNADLTGFAPYFISGFAHGPQIDPWTSGDVWLNVLNKNLSHSPGTSVFTVLVHEIGHAIGLGHPHDPDIQGAAPLPCEQDFRATSAMSYRDYPCDFLQATDEPNKPGYWPASPMQLDIDAIQYLYGVDTTTRTGDDVYFWPLGGQRLEVIWDAGGIDTIDWSNQTAKASIDLESGSWSVLGKPYTWEEDGGGSFPGTVAIAKGVAIENALGGAGDDLMFGNGLANLMGGGAGADIMEGGDGDDLLDGGSGSDQLDGGAGGDRLGGFDGADRLIGRGGDDYLDGGAGDDVLIDDRQAAGAPSISPSDDELYAGPGADLLDGGPGDDFLSDRGDDGGRDLFVFTMQPAGPDRPLATIAPGRDKVELFTSAEDALRFVHDPDTPGGPSPYTLASMLLEQNGGDLVISFSGLPRAETEVTLLDVALPSLATGAIEFESFPGQAEVPQLYVFGASQVRSTVFAPNATTWLNQLNNSVTGFEGGNDVINGQGGNDVLRGLAGHDLLRGERGADYLLGGRGNDRLEGGEGNDRLRGDFGDDLLLGGAGADRFEFVADRGSNLGRDTIADFESGQDDVVLRLAGGFASLDSNGNGVLDDPDAAVAISGGSTVVTLAAGAYNPVQFTVAGVADLHSADFLFV